MAAADDPGLVEGVSSWLAAAQRVVVLTGAGISTDSGIPDFRGPQGVWTRNPGAERTSNIREYVASAEVRKAAWRNRLASPPWTARTWWWTTWNGPGGRRPRATCCWPSGRR